MKPRLAQEPGLLRIVGNNSVIRDGMVFGDEKLLMLGRFRIFAVC